MRLIGWLLVCWFLVPKTATWAQLLDHDTLSDLRYNISTTGLFQTNDLYWGQEKTYALDSLMERRGVPYSVAHFNQFHFANLGNLGTSARRLQYEFDLSPAAKTGWESQYQLFFQSARNAHFYDTKGPFLWAYVLFGAIRRAEIDVGFAQNMGPRAGFSFAFNSLYSEQAIGWNQSANINQLQSPTYSFNSFYFSKDSAYHCSFAFARMNRRIWESGGYKPADNQPTHSVFSNPAPLRHLNHAVAIQRKYDLNVFNRYRIAPKDHLFLTTYMTRAHHEFKDDLGTDDSLFYQNFFLSKRSTHNHLRFDEYAIDAGWIHQQSRWVYRLYGRYRYLHYSDHLSSPTPFSAVDEYALGAQARFSGRKTGLNLETMLLLSGHYALNARWKMPYLEAEWRHKRYKTPFLLQYYRGNHYQWDHSSGLATQSAHHWALRSQLGRGVVCLKPFFQLTRQNHYIFFDGKDVKQLRAPQYLTQSGMTFEARFLSKFRLKSDFFYTKAYGTAPYVWGISPVLTQSELRFDDTWFQRSLQVTISVLADTRVRYHAMAYQPAIQQFYPQQSTQLQSYTRIDAYARIKINHFAAVIHINHLNQKRTSGYFITPDYPALGRLFDMRILYFFFD